MTAINISVEEAMKLIVSGGLYSPSPSLERRPGGQVGGAVNNRKQGADRMSRSSVKETEMKQAARENAARPCQESQLSSWQPGWKTDAVQACEGAAFCRRTGDGPVLGGPGAALPTIDCRHRRPPGRPRQQVIKDATGHRNGHVPIAIVEQRNCWGPAMRSCRRGRCSWSRVAPCRGSS